MANYKETNAEGTTWRRARQVEISNPLTNLPGAKAITFYEEDVAVIGGKTFSSNAGTLRVVFNPEQTIPLLDLDTGEPTGMSVDHKRVYQILYSLYINTATIRDLEAPLPPAVIDSF